MVVVTVIKGNLQLSLIYKLVEGHNFYNAYPGCSKVHCAIFSFFIAQCCKLAPRLHISDLYLNTKKIIARMIIMCQVFVAKLGSRENIMSGFSKVEISVR